MPKELDWSLKIQNEIAMPIYRKIWPYFEIIHLDDKEIQIKKMLDVAGADKLIREPNGGIFFMGQRFRTHTSSLAKGYDDFTLRHERPKTDYKAECYKIVDAIKKGKLLSAYYTYGHVNQNETAFNKFRIINFRKFINQWVNGLLEPYQHKINPDYSSSFYAWKFKDLPKSCIYWELGNPNTFDNYLIGGI